MKAKTKLVKVDWDADCKSDLKYLPKVVDVPAQIFDDDDEDAVCDYLSDNYDFCVNSWSELTDAEEIAYNCTKCKDCGRAVKAAKKAMKETPNIGLAWIDENLYMGIDYEIGTYCRNNNIDPKKFDVLEIFELIFNFL